MPKSGEIQQFVNCRILYDHQIIREDLWVRDGKILNPEKLIFDDRLAADYQIDCNNAIISPGFIDVQINGECICCGQEEYTNYTSFYRIPSDQFDDLHYHYTWPW